MIRVKNIYSKRKSKPAPEIVLPHPPILRANLPVIGIPPEVTYHSPQELVQGHGILATKVGPARKLIRSR